MSSDLFAAFGEEPPQAAQKPSNNEGLKNYYASDVWKFTTGQENNAPQDGTQLRAAATTHTNDDLDNDDFGDFEEAGDVSLTSTNTDVTEGATHIPGNPAASYLMPDEPEVAYPSPKAQKRAQSPRHEHSKIGKHPFAERMDFLFEAGDDEYDAGQDDLANLANDPEAAMAYSKRIIAEQEARLQKAKEQSSSSVVQSQTLTSQSRHTSTLPRHSRPPADTEKRGTTKLTSSAPNIAMQAVQAQTTARNKLRKKSGYAPAKDPSVLFDAEHISDHESDDDDFGDFEDPTTPVVGVTMPSERASVPDSSSPQTDMLGIDEAPAQTDSVRSNAIWTLDSLLGQPKHHKSSSLADVASVMTEEVPWEDFDSHAPPKGLTTASLPHTAAHAQEDLWADFGTSNAASQEPFTDYDDAAIPQPIQWSITGSHAANESVSTPTNIPPPALLLSLFPSWFSFANENLYTPLSRLDAAQRRQLVSHPATHTFLRNIVHDSIVLAHIIAGRKLRWKRDQILAQSMRIGQAGMGGRSGMKLSSIDKSEAVQEEREVADAVRLWKTHVGKLRGAMTSTRTAAPSVKLHALPEISETMPIKTLKSIEGGFSAPHGCALCGLKREERVAKVDVDVDDSFGEWWVQGIDMHINCRRWWNSNKSKLKSR
ncbi:hypothetical protein DOTSEDRAFT_67822 [Dothistroma septosporum NZE10]|uniref:Uncharacterized protein n=1 Tax=Dothistroma septosporum (strain NZE10 / CBS 128990) TaxID=675120 RepID=N1Q320_DOTSN|nr:hypothetical protein DOTSEDRAFT_67822 [Dothistroma septosporum NZE10]